MTYGDQAFRFRGEGFRDEPDFHPETGTSTSTPVYHPGTYNPDEYSPPTETTCCHARSTASSSSSSSATYGVRSASGPNGVRS